MLSDKERARLFDEMLLMLKQAAGVIAALQPNRVIGGIQDRIEELIDKAEGKC